ncbi:MAG: T9SS type A sorting domain-containing protein, partial [Ignavibacteriaceae bacterium]
VPTNSSEWAAFSYSLDGVVSSVEILEENIPVGFSLAQNYPNPFNPSTIINYSVPQTAPVRIKVFDITGSEVAVLVNEVKNPGNYQIIFDAYNIASGVYFYQMSAGEFISVRKMSILK